MKKQRHQKSESTVWLHLWTYEEAINALPYFRAVLQSLREHWLDVQQARRQVQRVDARPGRPDRQALILRAEALREAERAQDDLEETLRELQALDVHSLDPAQGLALIPFRHGEELAWFVFDLFAPQELEAWRLHTDPLETRRPLVGPLGPAVMPKLPTAEVDHLMSQDV